MGPPPTTSFGLGSNLGAKTDLLRALPFDERYRGAGEERDWCQNMVAAGYRFRHPTVESALADVLARR